MRGFFGKIPARGDFVRAGLPGGFVAAWDAWAAAALVESRAALGDAWLDCWLEAPVWRFALPPGACGPDAAIGVMLPSIDRAGRHFPLVLAQCAPTEDAARRDAADLLAAAEAAGCDAIAADLDPEAILARLADFPPIGTPLPALPELPPGLATWWTEGAPRLAPARFECPGLPAPARFAAMLADPGPMHGSGQPEPGQPESGPPESGPPVSGPPEPAPPNPAPAETAR